MRAFHYRPLASGSAYLRRVAKRLASTVNDKGGVRHEIHDGYLLRAVGSRSSVTVTAIDPEALWLFLHQQTPPSGSLQRLLGVRQFDREQIAGNGPDTATEPASGNPLTRWAPGAGYASSIDMGALVLLTNVPTLPSVRPDRISGLTLGNTSDYTIGAATFDTRFQLYGQALDPMRARIVATGTDMTGEPIRAVDVQDWLLRESALQALLGDGRARMQVRMVSSYPWYAVPIFGAQVAREAQIERTPGSGLSYADVVVAGAYASQNQSAPRDGLAGVFITRLRRPEPIPSAQYPLTEVWTWSLRADANPEPEFVPATVTPSGEDPRVHAHGITGVAMSYSGDVDDDTTLLLAGLHCAQGDVADPAVWVGLQLHRIARDGTLTTTTLRKTTDALHWQLGPEVELYGVNGVLAVECDVSGGTIDQSGMKLCHVGTDGVMRETGLRSAGWRPFTQTIVNPTGKTAGAVWGQASVYAADIGNGKVGVLARDYNVAADATAVTWTLVALDALTGSFIEARGMVADDAAVTQYSAHLSVLVPERLKADDTVAPAVLLCTLGKKHRISRDGGMTWTLLFDEYVGFPIYLGNRLHKVGIGRGL